MNTQLSVSAAVIMNHLLAGPALSKAVAKTTGLALPVVTGSLAGLKKNGFVEVLDNKQLKLTDAGVLIVSPAKAVVEYAKPVAVVTKRNKGGVKAAAVAIVLEEEGSKRAVIVKRFINELGMSPQGASTYHYNLVGNKGRWK